MAKLKNGIFGKATNKLGGTVMSTWRGINIAREKVTPANPNTARQSQVRGVFRTLVFIGRAIYPIFITGYWNKLAKGKPFTGWSSFMGFNQKANSLATDLTGIRFATGNLEGVKNIFVQLDYANNTLNVTWTKETTSNGLGTDKVYLHVYSPKRKYLYTQTDALSRNDELGKVHIPNLANVGDNNILILTLQQGEDLFSTSQTSLFDEA
jgi:hypothetical protein